jgi:hypothetical protein
MTQGYEFGLYLAGCYSIMGLLVAIGWRKKRLAARSRVADIYQGKTDIAKPAKDDREVLAPPTSAPSLPPPAPQHDP